MKTIDSDNWQDLLPQVLQIAGIGIWELVSSPDGLRMLFSSSIYTLFGYDQGKIQGRFETFVQQICHPDFQKDLQQTIDNAILFPGDIFHFEFQVWSEHTGAWRWVYAFGKALPTDNPGDVLIRGGVQDIHERRAALQQLERSQKKALQL